MKLVSIERVRPGDKIGQCLLGKDGNILLREGVALTNAIIKKLKELGIFTIYIQDSNLDDILPEDPKFVQVKQEAVKSLSKVFSKLQYSNNFQVKETLKTIAEIIEYLLDNKDVSSSHLLEIKTFDNDTYIHSLNTCVLALFFGVQMRYSRDMLLDLGTGALFHDIGKLRVPKNILRKEGRLTDEEYEIMKGHPELGFELVKGMSDMGFKAKQIILEHHERIDGNGYPRGLSGNGISVYSRITCISDVYDAIVSDRVYRKKFNENEAYEFILAGSGSFFDYNIVQCFRDNFTVYPLGVCVSLSDGNEGFVVKHNKSFPDRPVVRIVYNKKKEKIEPIEIDLVKTLDICINKVIL